MEPKKIYTEKEVVDFGNHLLSIGSKYIRKNEPNYTNWGLLDFCRYLLSDKRSESIECEDNLGKVHDCDIRNWSER